MTIELSESVIDAIADAVVKKMQEPKTGHWIDDGYYSDNSNESVWRCSECDHHIIEYDMEGYKFCPNCGCYNGGDKNEHM